MDNDKIKELILSKMSEESAVGSKGRTGKSDADKYWGTSVCFTFRINILSTFKLVLVICCRIFSLLSGLSIIKR